MTYKEPILDAGRAEFARITGTALSNWGMLPDPAHLEGGGYHCGCQDIINIGRWGTAGSSTADYSVRQKRDRVGGNTCMAIDGPPKWGNGGDAAWIRHNNLLQQAMAAGDPDLGALRAINYTPDGKVKRRYDTLHREAGIIVSTDTVLWHTHYEFWRDTAGTSLLRLTITRMGQIMQAAISNNINGGDDMSIWDESIGGLADGDARPARQVFADIWNALYHGGGAPNPNNLAQGGYSTKFPRSLWAETEDIKVAIEAIPTEIPLPSPLGDVTVAVDTVVAALESDAGQAALTKASNKAEDS